jgi:GDP-mannose 6-dehydrogenase
MRLFCEDTKLKISAKYLRPGLAFGGSCLPKDLRESPTVALVEMLIGKRLNLAIYHRGVSCARPVGANREYIEREIPHIWSLVRGSVQEVLEYAEVVLIGNSAREVREIGRCLREGQTVIDLVRAFEPDGMAKGSYQGICW